MPKLSGVLVALCAFSLTQAALGAEIVVKRCQPVDEAGNNVSPKLGESFFVKVEISLSAGRPQPYVVRVRSPYETRWTPPIETADGHPTSQTVVWGPLTCLTERAMPVRVDVLPQTPDSGRGGTFSVTPVLPTKGVETFDRRLAKTTLSAEASVSGAGARVEWWAAVPPNLSWQRHSQTRLAGATMRRTSAYVGSSAPVVRGDSMFTVEFATQTSSVRTNPARLRTMSMDSLLRIPIYERRWTRPETLVESRDPRVAAFARAALPNDFRRRPIYDVAEALFRATVARMTYEPLYDGRPSAVRGLVNGRGDCGYFSALFVAACRSVGIPARCITGVVEVDGWHVWAEFYVPNYGWIPVDPTYSKLVAPDGSEAVYFATLPNLNRRVALAVGYDQYPGEIFLPFMQAPAGIARGGTVTHYGNEGTVVTRPPESE